MILNDYGKVCKGCTIYIILLIIIFITNIGISSAFFISIDLRRKNISVKYINLVATYVKMLYQIDVSEGIDVNKSNKSKECMICH